MHIPITLEGTKTTETKALIDSGAGEICISKEFTTSLHLPFKNLSTPITVYNVDSTRNKQRTISQAVCTSITCGGVKLSTRFLITGLGKETIILELPWLQQFNSKIDWKKETVHINPITAHPILSAALCKAIDQMKDSTITLSPTPSPTIKKKDDEKDID